MSDSPEVLWRPELLSPGVSGASTNATRALFYNHGGGGGFGDGIGLGPGSQSVVAVVATKIQHLFAFADAVFDGMLVRGS